MRRITVSALTSDGTDSTRPFTQPERVRGEVRLDGMLFRFAVNNEGLFEQIRVTLEHRVWHGIDSDETKLDWCQEFVLAVIAHNNTDRRALASDMVSFLRAATTARSQDG